MRRRGRIVSLRDGNTAPAAGLSRRVVVELDASPACLKCARGRGCGAALFAPTAQPVRLECQWSSPASPATGTPVDVEIDDPGSGWLRPVVLAYGLPTLGLLVGTCFPEPWTPLTALLGLGGGILAWRVRFARECASDTFLATIDPSPNGPGSSGETR